MRPSQRPRGIDVGKKVDSSSLSPQVQSLSGRAGIQKILLMIAIFVRA